MDEETTPPEGNVPVVRLSEMVAGPTLFLPHQAWALTNPTPNPECRHPEMWDQIPDLPADLKGMVTITLSPVLGIGGNAVVYEGQLESNGVSRAVAVKVAFIKRAVDGSLLADETARSVAREMRISRALQHPNIAHYYGMCYDPIALKLFSTIPALVFAHCAGRSAIKYLANHPTTKRLPLVRGIVDGLAYMHEFGIIHGDLNPRNVLIKLDESGIRAVLNDFGSSVIASEDTTWLGDDIDYSAPEIKTKESHVTTMSDIYSLALTTLAIVSDKPAFDGDPLKIREMRTQGLRPDRADHPALEIDDNMWECIVACWAHQPEARWSASQVVSFLGQTQA
ncbi:Protein kinase-like domain superfamily protein [Pleurotus pulmonarius]